MTDQLKPLGHGDAIMEAFFAEFVRFAFGDDRFRKMFEESSGMKLPTGRESGITAMIDKTTGYQDAVLTKFCEWCITEHWGKAE